VTLLVIQVYMPSFDNFYLVTPRELHPQIKIYAPCHNCNALYYVAVKHYFNVLYQRLLVVLENRRSLEMNIQGGCWWRNFTLQTTVLNATKLEFVMRPSKCNLISVIHLWGSCLHNQLWYFMEV
jgi:hypothetical protein